MYSVKEMFYSLQGEGLQTGRPSIFVRFAGCNLWSGREQDRATAVCDFCDTDFVGVDGQHGGKFATVDELCKAILALWPARSITPYIIFTGGEPALQLDQPLVDKLHELGCEIGIESNGTRPLPSGIDWVCISPKGDSEVIITECDELKLVFPQPKAMPERFEHIQAKVRFLSPLNPPDAEMLILSTQETVKQALQYCLDHPQWRLSLQTHKLLNID